MAVVKVVENIYYTGFLLIVKLIIHFTQKNFHDNQ